MFFLWFLVTIRVLCVIVFPATLACYHGAHKRSQQASAHGESWSGFEGTGERPLLLCSPSVSSISFEFFAVLIVKQALKVLFALCAQNVSLFSA